MKHGNDAMEVEEEEEEVLEEKAPAPVNHAAGMEEAPAKVNVTDTVYAWLKNRYPHAVLVKKEMVVDADIDLLELSRLVYLEYPYLMKIFKGPDCKALHAVVESYLSVPGSPARGQSPSEEELIRLEQAFTATFIGTSHQRLLKYIRACWTRYSTQHRTYRYPYIALVQSSGFGKSRLLRECAQLGHGINKDKSSGERFHLLYVCVRDVARSTGFPVATTELREHLFPSFKESATTEELVEQLTRRLVRVYDFVMQASVDDIDAQLLRLFSRDPTAQASFCKPASGSPPNRAKSKATKVLIVAIDEAQALLPVLPDMKNKGWFRCFHYALAKANEVLRGGYGPHSGLFGIVVDTNSKLSKVSDYAPSAQPDPSRRSREIRLFPPFVLTETVDIFHTLGETHDPEDLAFSFKQRVLAAVTQLAAEQSRSGTALKAWEDLRMLGRPLWGSRHDIPHVDLIALAADKLLNRFQSAVPASFNSSELCGVASVMCRLGIRPLASSALASQAVADFMAVLSYVSADRKQFFVSYSSDPILTLGATKLWHSMVKKPRDTDVSPTDARKKRRVEYEGSSNLSRHILPHFNVLLRQEVLETGDTDDFVARIVLLLAMDACGVLETGNEDMRWQGAGEFYRVSTLLRALEGSSVAVHRRKEAPVKSLEDIRGNLAAKWTDYFVSFTHFVQLSEEPTETCLWGLLGRRAAAVLPRGHNGADFIIPICRPDEELPSAHSGAVGTTPSRPPVVTMILVQVKNHHNGCSTFLQAVTEKLDPSFVFSESNSLSSIKPDDVFRVYMSLREQGESKHKYIEVATSPSSFALGIFGLGPWASRPLVGESEPVEVVSPAVANELSRVLEPWWRVADKVDADLENKLDRVESNRAIFSTAVIPLGDSLVLNTTKW